MAIEISQKLAKTDHSSAAKLFLIIGIALLFLSGIGYLYLQDLNKKTEIAINSAEQQIDQTRNDDVKAAEKEISNWSQKIKDYNLIFSSHEAPSNILSLLEKDAHPQVQWTKFNFIADSATDPGSTSFEGLASDFVSLQQQIIILSKDPSVKNTNLTDISLTKDGKISFDLDIKFSPAILNPKASE